MKLILENIASFVTSKLTLYATPIYYDKFQSDTNDQIVIRAEPGVPVETRYLDESRLGRFNFSFYARSEDGSKATNQLSDIQVVLDVSQFELTSGIMITCTPTTNPSIIQKTDAGISTYSCGFSVEYYIQG